MVLEITAWMHTKGRYPIIKWVLVMVTINNGVPQAESIATYERIADCYFNITQQEMKYDFDTLKRDWVCVRSEGDWDLVLRY